MSKEVLKSTNGFLIGNYQFGSCVRYTPNNIQCVEMNLRALRAQTFLLIKSIERTSS
jgi:hypothetical protein